MNIRINIGQVFNIAVAADDAAETPNSARIYSLRNGAEAVFISELAGGENLLLGPFINIVDYRIDMIGNVTVENVATNFGAPVLLSDYVGGGGGGDTFKLVKVEDPAVFGYSSEIGPNYMAFNQDDALAGEFGPGYAYLYEVIEGAAEQRISLNGANNYPLIEVKTGQTYSKIAIDLIEIIAGDEGTWPLFQLSGFGAETRFSVQAEGNSLVAFAVGLPTAEPVEVGQLWNDGGTLKISAGA